MPFLPASLPRICVALGLPSAPELMRAAEQEFKDGNAFLEFRLDYLEDPTAGVDVMRRVRNKHANLHILATCRHKEHSGHFAGTIEQQVRILQQAGESGACALDLEVESAECVLSSVDKLRKSAALIISFHDFAGTPALGTVMNRLRRIPADAYKIATTARKPGDNARLIRLVRETRDIPIIAFAMSEVGVPTRILAPGLGCLFTYAAPAAAEGTAPGQIAAKTMRGLYRTDKVTKDTRIYGVVADPVSHSKSPLIHNRAFHARRFNGVYLPFLVASAHLGEWMKLAAEYPVAGFSVTIPHKQKIMQYLDAIDPLAKRIGAVNTVWRKAGRWRGTNTDVQGLLKPLTEHVRISRSSVLVAGYGGAARAAAIALADEGARITITGRDLVSAQKLARVVRAEAISLSTAEHSDYDVVVNATPVGMSPHPGAALFERLPGNLVLDMVYNPHETLLLRRAKEQGKTIIHGSEMLLEQAACQFEIWTGESAPRSVMQNALDQRV